jgi:hypothetical protein
MNELVRALVISTAVLAPVVILTIVISIAVVKRGEAGTAASGHPLPDDPFHAKETASPAPAKAVKGAAPVSDEISVMHVLIFGVGVFTVAVLALLALSLIQHMM